MTSSYRARLQDIYKTQQDNDTKNMWKTHAGLWLEKYIEKQELGDNTGTRMQLVKEVATINETEEYALFYARWEDMLTSQGAQVRKAYTQGRLIVGLGSESVLKTSVALHQTYGVPYIPGSALKGLVSSYAHNFLGEQWQRGSDTSTILFGTTKEAGYITFFDALYIPKSAARKRPLSPDIITVHHQKYYQRADITSAPTDWDSPIPVPFLSATGHYLVALAAPQLEHAQQWIDKTFDILERALHDIGIGAKTSSGYGRMTLERKAEDDINEVIPEQASKRLLREIAASPQVTNEHFDGWQRLPHDDDGARDVAKEMLKKMESVGGKKRMPKEEKRYQVIKKYLENTDHD